VLNPRYLLISIGVVTQLLAPVPKLSTTIPQLKPKPVYGTRIFNCKRCGYDVTRRSNLVLASRHTYSPRMSRRDELALMKIIKRESGGRVEARNKRSSAFGVGQLLKSTYRGVNKQLVKQKKPPIRYGSLCPSCQVEATKVYIKSRYGTPSKAYQFWLKHHWY
jgi:hypothetical protein